MIDELIDAVARAGSLNHGQAAMAVGGMLKFLAARLPSPLFGELQTRLHLSAPVGDVGPVDRGSASGP